MADNDGKNVEITFDQPLYDSAKGLVSLMFREIDKISFLISDPGFNISDSRLELMVHHIISSFITDIKEQETLRAELEILINKYTDNASGNEGRGVARNKACLEFEGRVISRLHDLFGTTKKNRVGITWDPKECEIVDFR